MNTADRAILLSHPGYHQKNLSFIIDIFLSNDYPSGFIFDAINDRLKKFFNNQVKEANNSIELEEKQWFTIPYISNVSEKYFF